MGWFARLLGWATLFALPCWAIMEPYQKALRAVTAAVLEIVGVRVEMSELSLAAPLEVGMYAALCLASRSASPRRRKRALLLGIPALIAAEILSGVVVISILAITYRNPAAFEVSSRFTGYLIEFIPWISASALWLVLLGKDEVPWLDDRRRPPQGSPVKAKRPSEGAPRSS